MATTPATEKKPIPKSTVWALLVLYIAAASLVLLAISNPLVWALGFSLSLLAGVYLFLSRYNLIKPLEIVSPTLKKTKLAPSTLWGLLVVYILAAGLITLVLSNPLVFVFTFAVSLLAAAYLFLETEVVRKPVQPVPPTT